MADARDVLGRGAELDRHDRLGNQLARQAADRVHAEDAVGPRVGQDLDEALGLFAAERAPVVRERKAPGFVGDAFGLQLLLGLADPGDLRSSVDHPRDGVVVHVAALTGDDLGHRSEEHTSELQSQFHLVCRLLLEKKKYNLKYISYYTIT